MRKRMLVLLILQIAMIFSQSVYGSERRVTVSIPSFPVTLNEIRYDNNDYIQYPMFVYNDITYFPMTYYKSNLMNLNTSRTELGGLVITKGNPEIPKEVLGEGQGGSYNKKTQSAVVIESNVTVNGHVINNQEEQYPLLRFRDVTYFPLTWKYAVEEFGWSYTYDNTAGLNISADNYYFCLNYSTTYIKGDLKILLATMQNRLGPIPGNLLIIKNGTELRPSGYFGFYQENGPLFTVDSGIINTTQVTVQEGDMFNREDNYEARMPKPCRISIETGKII